VVPLGSLRHSASFHRAVFRAMLLRSAGGYRFAHQAFLPTCEDGAVSTAEALPPYHDTSCHRAAEVGAWSSC
jgi:hypothetical protein